MPDFWLNLIEKFESDPDEYEYFVLSYCLAKSSGSVIFWPWMCSHSV